MRRREASGFGWIGLGWVGFARLGLICAATLFAAGCGDGDSGTAPKAIVIEDPKTPTNAECGLSGKGSAKDADKPPKPGKYLYVLEGRRVLVGDQKEVTPLPSQMQTIVTDSYSAGAQSCFAVQRRYEKDLGDTGVFVINGREMLLRSGEFQAGGDIAQFVPDPPITVIDDDELEWSGEFSGQTQGRYSVNVVGRKRMRIGGESVPVIGLSTRVSYAGEVEGIERSTRWFSTKHRIVVAETVTQERTYGLDRLRLTYKSRLQSVDPQ